MSEQFDARDYPLARQTPRFLSGKSFWNMHIPFAFALTQMLRPRSFVELGTHRGDSYCAFCQAVDALDLDARCYAVGTWAGDIHTGHRQPHLPADLGFYDLRLPETRQAQADLAREYGISGFCYYHYWFQGRRILDRPLDEMLASGEPDFPFCLCWANHTWTSKWNIRKGERLIEQHYSEEDDREHIRWLLGVFGDARYIRIDGRPLLLIYRVRDLPDPLGTISMWKREARAGMAEPYVCKLEAAGDLSDPREVGCDAAVEFPPHKLDPSVKRVQGAEEFYRENRIFEYAERVEKHLGRTAPPYRRFPAVMPGFDSTPRHRSGDATILRGSTPELYGRWLAGALESTSSHRPEERIVFINAWNGWTEGNHLEPDLEDGHAYLEATRRALEASGVEVDEVAANTATGGADDGTTDAPLPSPEAFTLQERYRHLLYKYTKLQQRLTEQLRSEEPSGLTKQLRESYERVKRQHSELWAHHKELQQRHREQNERKKALRGRLRKEREKVDGLLYRVEELDAGVSALLASRRWKLGDALGRVGRRALLKPPARTAAESLLGTLGELRNLRSQRKQEGKERQQPAKPSPAKLAQSSAGDGESAIKEEDVVWILGAPRTGSTWLSRMLRQLDGIEVWQEPFFGVMMSFRDNIANQGHAANELFLFGEPNKDIWLEHMKRLFLAVGEARFGRPERLVVKEPNGSVGARLVLEAFPHSSAILLVRDPRDVVASRLDAAKPGSWYGYDHFEMSAAAAQFDPQTGSFDFPEPKSEDGRVERLAHDVAASFAAARQAFDAHAGRKVLIKYEDLRAEPLGTMKRLCSALGFVGLAADEEGLRRALEKASWENIPAEKKGEGKHHRKATPGSWREDLTPQQAETVEKACATLIEELYPG